MCRTVNRPATNITPPTTPHPAAAHLGVKAARAVTRHAHVLTAALDGPVSGSRFEARDYRILDAAGLVVRAGSMRQDVELTEAGRVLAAALTADRAA